MQLEINYNSAFGPQVHITDRNPVLQVDGPPSPWKLCFTVLDGDPVDYFSVDNEGTRGPRFTLDRGKAVEITTRTEFRSSGAESILTVHRVSPRGAIVTPHGTLRSQIVHVDDEKKAA